MTVSGEKMANKIKMLLLKKNNTENITSVLQKFIHIFQVTGLQTKKTNKKTLRLLKLKRERERNYNQQYKNSKFK